MYSKYFLLVRKCKDIHEYFITLTSKDLKLVAGRGSPVYCLLEIFDDTKDELLNL